jgi:ribosomal protein L24
MISKYDVIAGATLTIIRTDGSLEQAQVARVSVFGDEISVIAGSAYDKSGNTLKVDPKVVIVEAWVTDFNNVPELATTTLAKLNKFAVIEGVI